MNHLKRMFCISLPSEENACVIFLLVTESLQAILGNSDHFVLFLDSVNIN